MKIALTPGQITLLKNCFDEANAACDAGNPGAVFAQIKQTTDGGAYMDVRFNNNETTEKIRAVLGTTTPFVEEEREVTVLIPDDNA